ncbi:hypothetical protein PR048_012795, partial [Dryococelus australis]
MVKAPKQPALYPSTNAIDIYQPSCSNKITVEGISIPRQGSSFLVSPKAIMPVSKTSLSKKKMTVHRNHGKTAILTEFPYENELLSLNTKLPMKLKPKQTISKIDSSKDDSCLYCCELYSASTEGCINCVVCKMWFRNSCAGVNEYDDEAVHVSP